MSVCVAEAPELTANKTEEYNKAMQRQMGWDSANPYEYHYDRGLYYHEIIPGLFCGSQPRNPEDINVMKEEVNPHTILNLQQDKDMLYWGVDHNQVHRRCQELGVKLVRRPARDFDPDSLRTMLPAAVRALAEELSQGHRVYVHCTAGLGRAPAVCIAYLYWFKDMQLDEAYQYLTRIRPCGPKRDAIRGATFDIMDSRRFEDFYWLPKDAWAFLNKEDRQRLIRKLFG